MSAADRAIPLARLVREHGFVKDGLVTYKAQLFSPGGLIFKGRRDFLFSPAGEGVAVRSNRTRVEAQKIHLSENPAPLGGSWGQARAVLLKLDHSEATRLQIGVGTEVSLPRGEFAPLDTARGEFYLCDLLGLPIRDESGAVVGHVHAFFENGQAHNLECQSVAGGRFEFPLKWVDWTQSKLEDAGESYLVVPEIGMWTEIK